jgi:hypothetical protein
LNWRWLPRVATKNPPSPCSIRVISLTFTPQAFQPIRGGARQGARRGWPGARSSEGGRLCPFAASPVGSPMGPLGARIPYLAGRGGSSEIAEDDRRS